MMRLLLFVVAAASTACGGPRCGDHERNDVERAPRADGFYLLDEHVPGDPWSVLVGIDFSDRDGNLGRGTVEFYLNDSTKAASQKLYSVFRQSGVPFEATTGSVWTNIRFADSVSDGSRAEVGMQLIDEEGLRSNCYSVDIRFEVTQAMGRELRRIVAAVGRPCRRLS